MNKLKLTIGIIGALALLDSCTDLVVKEKDSIVVKTESGAFKGIDPAAGLDKGYKDLRDFGDQANFYALNEISSDELLCPTRGTDWGDNGVWRTVHQHTWDATHPMVLVSWNQLNSHVYQLYQELAPESAATPAQVAEAKFLRALNMYWIMDLFRQIPVRETTDAATAIPKVMTGQAAIDFMVKDLTDALPGLPNKPSFSSKISQASKAAANLLLAKIYLNKHTFLGNASADPADMNKVIQYVDAITGLGYAVESMYYFDIFRSTADTETIFWMDANVGNRMWSGMHYNMKSPDNDGGGWNGFSTTAEFYGLFEGNSSINTPGSAQEDRRGYVPTDGKKANIRGTVYAGQNNYGFGYGFLIGQQYDGSGNSLKNRQGAPLSFTKEYPNGIIGNNEVNGIRVLKYSPADGAFADHQIFFRYADAHLMKVEAMLRGGTPTSGTVNSLMDELRTKRGASVKASYALSDVLDERGRELYIEGWRRNDQVRFGTFNKLAPLMPTTDPKFNIYPIPATAVASNPNLKQNPGY